MIVCRVCGSKNEDGTTFCWNCGAFLEWSGERGAADAASTGPAPPAGEAAEHPPEAGAGDATRLPLAPSSTPVPAAQPPRPTSWGVSPAEPGQRGSARCPVCGGANDPGRTFCGHCGNRLAPDAPEEAEAAPADRPGARIPVRAILVAAAIVVVVGSALVVRGLLVGGPEPSLAPPASPTTAPSEAETDAPTPPPSAALPEGEIAFAGDQRGNLDIYVINADGTGLRRITNRAGDEKDPDFSPDGSRVLWADGKGIWVASSRNGSGSVRLARSGINPVWSPDGTSIAFAIEDDTDLEVYVQSATPGATDRLQLTMDSVDDYDPTWSPAGNRLAFTRGDTNARDIIVTDLSTHAMSQITQDAGDNVDPDWSPDGSRIAFSSNRSGGYDIWIVDADGANPVRVTSDGANNHDPAWSPDGRFIAYSGGPVAGSDKPRDLFIAEAATGQTTRLGTTGGRHLWPSWH